MKSEDTTYPEFYETQAVLSCGSIQTDIEAKIYPKLLCGSFWLNDETLVYRVTTEAATLRTKAGLHVSLLKVHRCPAHHFGWRAGTHIEFDYKVMEDVSVVGVI